MPNNQNNQPLVAAAIHDGHGIRPELEDIIALGPGERLREEDPYTGAWTAVAGIRIIGERSRFEADLNRPRDKAVYIHPEDAWGLKVWKSEPKGEVKERSLSYYDDFYSRAREILSEVERRHGTFVVFDLHTYNHRRDGADDAVADPSTHPEVNIGTGTMDRSRWAPLVERFMADLRGFDFAGRHLDVRENVKFQGGYFPRWIHQNFAGACAIAIEWKKFFMDEWTGRPDFSQMDLIPRALEATVPGVLEELRKLAHDRR